MPSLADMDAFETRALTRLAELGMRLAEDAAERAAGAPTAEEAQGLMLAFERVARSVRLTFALRRRLQEQRESAARQADAGAVEARRKRVRREIKADIEALPGVRERVDLSAALDERLDEEALDRRFLDGPVEACVARIRRGLGLPAAEGADDPAPEPSAYEPLTRKVHGGPAPRARHPVGLSP